jgi:para-aminobenzoate synthetase/4-amino-4-deoxychorismate lyase
LVDPVPVFVAVEAALAAGQWVALAADYALGASFERAILRQYLRVGRCCGPGRLPMLNGSTRKRVQAFLAGRLAAIPEEQRAAGIAELFAGRRSQRRHAAQVRQVCRWIADGDCYQVNLTFPLTFRIYGHPLALYARLRARQPVRYGGYVEIGEEAILSFSPELFFERHGSRVLTRPMKGTAPRGRTPREDEGMLAALLSSAKERAENIMIVDLLRNDLGRLAQPGKVHVEALCEAEAYPTLWQMVSTVAAELPGTEAWPNCSARSFPAVRLPARPRYAPCSALPSWKTRRAGCTPVPSAGWRPGGTVVSASPFGPLRLTPGVAQGSALAVASSPTPTPTVSMPSAC